MIKLDERKNLLQYLKGNKSLDFDDISLFEWYIKEVESYTDLMLEEEKRHIKEQIDLGAEDINDSGMVAVNYFAKRSRYSNVIHLCSLLEKFLKAAIEKLITILGDDQIRVFPNEIKGSMWDSKRIFLERYGRFSFPTDLWKELELFIKIRNHLVHDDGEKDRMNDNQLREFNSLIKKRNKENLIYFDNSEEVNIDKKYIYFIIDIFKKFIDFIDNEFDTLIERSIKPSCLK